jgi:chromosome segregation ATPase
MVGADDAEMENLKRTSRMTDRNRKQYSEDAQNEIRKQRLAIERLRKENEHLKEEIAMANRTSGKLSSQSMSAQIARLQDQADVYIRKIEMEKRALEEADKQVKVLTTQLLQSQQERGKQGGVNAARDNEMAVNKSIRILENRLDKALVKFNDALAYNKQLREQIDNLRRERVVFDEIQQKLARELQEKKKQMAQVIEVSNVAYEARDQAQTEINLLKAQSDREQAAFEGEIRELNKLIEQDKKLKERIGATETAHRGKLTVDEEKNLKRTVVKGNWNIAKEKAAKAASAEKVQSFEEAFAQIQAATGISNIDELVNTFIDAEDQNFSLFNYVNELNNEVEKLEEQIAEIKQDIDKYKGQGGQNDRQRKKLLKDLEDRLAATESKADQYEQKSLKASKTVAALEAGIQSIFTKIGCSNSTVSEMLGTMGVTESNIMQYLGIIEQRTNELLQMWKTQQQQSAASATMESSQATTIHPGPSAPPGGVSISIDPPMIGDDDDSEEDSDDDEERPLSRDELKAKTIRGLSKKEGQKANKAAKKKEAMARKR